MILYDCTNFNFGYVCGVDVAKLEHVASDGLLLPQDSHSLHCAAHTNEPIDFDLLCVRCFLALPVQSSTQCDADIHLLECRDTLCFQ